jgi:N-acyl homoserine lactone hydrolase
VEIFFLTCGTLRVPALAVGKTRLVFPTKTAALSNTVAVIVRDAGDVVLVDVGWSRDACADAAGALGRLRALTLGVRVREGDAIADQLEAHGIAASRVKTIVATHLHLDHVGGVCDFPDAEVVAADRELTAYRGASKRSGYRAEDLARAGRIRAIDFDGAPTYGFRASHDLFGDGQIVLLDARGHTAGSVAVAMRTSDRAYVHIGDAAYQAWEYGMSPRGPSALARMTVWKRDEQAATYAAIRACEADPRKPVVVPSHDAGVFASLPQSPA